MSSKEELIKKIENTRYSAAAELENPSRKIKGSALMIWGHTLENHVRRIVKSHEGAELFDSSNEFMKRRYHTHTDCYFSAESGLRQLKYRPCTDTLSIVDSKTPHVDKYEIDLLFRLEDEIIFGEVKYYSAKVKHRILSTDYYLPRKTALEKIFDHDVSYWGLANYEWIEKNPAVYKNFEENNNRLVRVQADAQSKEELYALLKNNYLVSFGTPKKKDIVNYNRGIKNIGHTKCYGWGGD